MGDMLSTSMEENMGATVPQKKSDIRQCNLRWKVRPTLRVANSNMNGIT